MFALILRILFYLFLVRFLWRLVYHVLEGVKGERDPAQPRVVSGQMVQDPVCGTYVVRGAALSEGSGASVAYFCSEECRQRFRAGRARTNGAA